MSRLSKEYKRGRRKARKAFKSVWENATAWGALDATNARDRRRRRDESKLRLERLREATENERFVVRRAFREVRGAQRASLGAAGVAVNTGTGAVVQEQSLEDQVREERLLLRAEQQKVQDFRREERAADRARRRSNTVLGIKTGVQLLGLFGGIPTGGGSVGSVTAAQGTTTTLPSGGTIVQGL